MQVSFSLPPDELLYLEKLAGSFGLSKSEATRQALWSWLEIAPILERVARGDDPHAAGELAVRSGQVLEYWRHLKREADEG